MKSRSLFLVALILAGLLPSWAWALSYSTSFPSNENPISQSGVWVNGGATGLDWTNVAAAAGLAHGTQTGTASPATNDSVASLQAMGAWGPDQTVQATVRTVAHAGTNVFEEAELLLRFTIAAHSASGYEVLFSTNRNGYCQIVRWNGALNDFTLLEATSCTVSNGDTLKATIVWTVITQYVNGIVVQSHDTLGDTGPRYITGSPGIGFYFQTDGTGGSNGETGFTSYSADDGMSTPTTILTVAKTGAGTGTVTSTIPPGAINCGVDCTETVASGTGITLTASAATGSLFTGWSGGGCSGTGTCTVPMTADTTVTATFALGTTLTVSKSGAGTVTSTVPAGAINCGADCTAAVATGTGVTLTAAAGTGSLFTGWSGGGCIGTADCTVTMTTSVTVTATFAIARTLTVTTSGAGTGTVASTVPAGVINCGADCTETVASGTGITLTAATGTGSLFTAWSGGGCSGTGSCTVPMTGDTTVTATFAVAVALTVTKTGAGTGAVTSTTPPGTINCGGDCTETVVSGTVMTLTASASVGSAFGGWSGGGCSGTGTCSVTLTADTTVSADFALPHFQLTVTKGETGTGTVSGGGINCGLTCSESLLSGTTVLLDAAPDSTDYFVGWSGGGCSGTGSCSVTLTSDTTVTASFAPLALVQFSGANFTVSEGTASATITAVRSLTVSMLVQVHYETGGGTAVAGTDYTHTEGDLVFAPGQTTKTFTVPVMNTTRMDGPRTVVLHLKSPQGAQLGIQRTAVLTIADNDTPGKVNFSTTSYTAPDKPGMATITVRRSGGAASGVTVQYATAQGGPGSRAQTTWQ